MLISEIKEKFDSGLSFDVMEIEVKKYLPISHKQLIVDNIVEKCVIETENVKRVDYFIKKVILDCEVCKAYSNIEFEEDSLLENLDWLYENKFFDFLLDEIELSEMDYIIDSLDATIRGELDSFNSVGAVLSRGIDKLLSKIPDVSDIEKVKSLLDDPETMSKIQSVGSIFSSINNPPKPNRQQRRAKVKEESQE